MTTKLEVLGHRVLIDPEFVEEQHDLGNGQFFDLSFTKTVQYEKAACETGRVVSIGPNAWKAFDDGEPWAEVGDKVIFAKHGGKFVSDPDNPEKLYVVINDEDIQVRIKENEDE